MNIITDMITDNKTLEKDNTSAKERIVKLFQSRSKFYNQ